MAINAINCYLNGRIIDIKTGISDIMNNHDFIQNLLDVVSI